MAEKKTTTKTAKAVEAIEEVKAKPKTFKASDMIPCRSIVNGELFMVGEKSRTLYSWASYGDVQEVSYQDLSYDLRNSRTGFAKAPRFIILDDELVEQHPDLKEIYASMYSNGDLREILDLDVDRMRKEIENLPAGAKDAIKGLASSMVQNGTLDSVGKIKVLDELFGTKLIMALQSSI